MVENIQNPPLISVVMPVYNAEYFLEQAVESILNQTFRDFEFIIIDDCSTDESYTLLKKYDDPRIILLRNEQNSGIAKTLNHGIIRAKGKYIARMDADDIAFPKRFEHQIEYLENHPHVGALGTQVTDINVNGHKYLAKKNPLTHDLIVWSFMIEGGGAIAHPTAMIRGDVLQKCGGYATKYTASQDFDLWLRCIQITQLANLDIPLLYYRRHKASKSSSKSGHEQHFSIEIQHRALEDLLGRSVDIKYIESLSSQKLRNKLITEDTASAIIGLIIDIYQALVEKNFISTQQIPTVQQKMIQHIKYVSRQSPRGTAYWVRLMKQWGHLFLPKRIVGYWYRSRRP